MTSIHYPVISVPLKNGAVEVSDLPWPVAKELFEKLKVQGRAFVDDKGNIVFDANKIIEAISQSIGLCEWIAIKATGKDQSWLDERSLAEVAAVVGAAIEINLTVAAERAKNVRSRLSELTAGAKT